MKKILFAAAAVICAMACSKMESRDSEVFSNETLVPMTVSAVAPDAVGEMTKTTLEGTSVLWSSGDCIGIMAADGASKTVGKFTLASGKGTKNGTFSGSAVEAGKYYAFYPYKNAEETAHGVFSATITNSYSSIPAGSFRNTANLAAAVSEDGKNFNFTTVNALYRLNIPEEYVGKLWKIWISPCNGEKHAGNVTVDMTGSSPVVSAGSSSVIAFGTDGAGITSLVAGDYYFPVAPIDLAKGLYVKMQFKDKDGNSYFAYRANGTALSLKQNNVYDLGTISDSEELVYTSFEKGIPSTMTTWNKMEVADNSTVTETGTGKSVKVYTANSGSAGGMISFKVTDEASLNLFPSKVRGIYNRIRVKIYVGELEVFPTLKTTAGGADYFRLPSKINGVDFSQYAKTNTSKMTVAEQESAVARWQELIKTDDWNELEFCLEDWKEGLAASTPGLYYFYTMFGIDGANTTRTAGDCVYIDDIRFALSDNARTTSRL